MFPTGCSHGVSWEDVCVECEKLTERRVIESFSGYVARARRRLAELEGGDDAEEEHRVA